MGISLSREFAVISKKSDRTDPLAYFGTQSECVDYARKIWQDDWAAHIAIVDTATDKEIPSKGG